MGRGEVHTRFWWGNVRGGDNLEDPDVDGIIILKWIFDKWNRDMDYIGLAQDKDRCWARVNAVMNLRVA
jgi:hypothetical protein